MGRSPVSSAACRTVPGCSACCRVWWGSAGEPALGKKFPDLLLWDRPATSQYTTNSTLGLGVGGSEQDTENIPENNQVRSKPLEDQLCLLWSNTQALQDW